MCIFMRKRRKMQGKINLKSNKCNFKECRNYEDGQCLNEKDREFCLEVALAVLCLNEDDITDER